MGAFSPATYPSLLDRPIMRQLAHDGLDIPANSPVSAAPADASQSGGISQRNQLHPGARPSAPSRPPAVPARPPPRPRRSRNPSPGLADSGGFFSGVGGKRAHQSLSQRGRRPEWDHGPPARNPRTPNRTNNAPLPPTPSLRSHSRNPVRGSAQRRVVCTTSARSIGCRLARLAGVHAEP